MTYDMRFLLQQVAAMSPADEQALTVEHDERFLGCLLRIAAIDDPAWRRCRFSLARELEVRHETKGTRDAERVCGCQLYTALELDDGRPVDGIAIDLGCAVRTVQRWIKDDLLECAWWRPSRRQVSGSKAPRSAIEERPESRAAAPVDLREFRTRRRAS